VKQVKALPYVTVVIFDVDHGSAPCCDVQQQRSGASLDAPSLKGGGVGGCAGLRAHDRRPAHGGRSGRGREGSVSHERYLRHFHIGRKRRAALCTLRHVHEQVHCQSVRSSREPHALPLLLPLSCGWVSVRDGFGGKAYDRAPCIRARLICNRLSRRASTPCWSPGNVIACENRRGIRAQSKARDCGNTPCISRSRNAALGPEGRRVM
jgi:hypothetical protein